MAGVFFWLFFFFFFKKDETIYFGHSKGFRGGKQNKTLKNTVYLVMGKCKYSVPLNVKRRKMSIPEKGVDRTDTDVTDEGEYQISS